MATAVAVGYGLYVRVRRELVLSLHERNRRLEAEQDLRVREARHSERARWSSTRPRLPRRSPAPRG